MEVAFKPNRFLFANMVNPCNQLEPVAKSASCKIPDYINSFWNYLDFALENWLHFGLLWFYIQWMDLK